MKEKIIMGRRETSVIEPPCGIFQRVMKESPKLIAIEIPAIAIQRESNGLRSLFNINAKDTTVIISNADEIYKTGEFAE